MRNWLVKGALAHLSEVIEAALAGKLQRVTRRGKGALVVVSETEWDRIVKPESDMSFGELLAAFPLSPEEWEEVAPSRGPGRCRSWTKGERVYLPHTDVISLTSPLAAAWGPDMRVKALGVAHRKSGP